MVYVFLAMTAMVCSLAYAQGPVANVVVSDASSEVKEGSMVKWIPFPDSNLELRGLPWHSENAPDLWRFPKRAESVVHERVWKRAVAPGGGRIRLSCDTSRLAIRVQVMQGHGMPVYFDVYAGSELLGSANAKGTNEIDLSLFEGKERSKKDLVIYFPHEHQVRVLAVGVDPDTQFHAPPPFALNRPFVCYGSSVLQGTGASHGAMTYPAILARQMNLDFVNLGFGGAGKAEPEVVSLVSEIDACGFLFDLGKSYGLQPLEVYGKMLDTIRAEHPDAPIIVVTPIYSTKEEKDPAYKDKSEALRTLMRQAARERAEKGDERIVVVEGLDLFSEKDVDALNDPLHPNDEGNARVAQRLAPTVEKLLLSVP